jgi:hypothetical protein
MVNFLNCTKINELIVPECDSRTEKRKKKVAAMSLDKNRYINKLGYLSSSKIKIYVLFFDML